MRRLKHSSATVAPAASVRSTPRRAQPEPLGAKNDEIFVFVSDAVTASFFFVLHFVQRPSVGAISVGWYSKSGYVGRAGALGNGGNSTSIINEQHQKDGYTW